MSAPLEPIAMAHEPAGHDERFDVRVDVFEGYSTEPAVVGAVWHLAPLSDTEAFGLLLSRVAPAIDGAAACTNDEGTRRALERAAAQVRTFGAERRAELLDNPPLGRRAPRDGFVVHVHLVAHR